MQCVQCNNEVSTSFCPTCGQRSGVKRLTLRDSLADFWASVVGLDGIFFRTLKDLTRKPGYVALCYIRGIRMRYFGPIAYFFFMITLLLLCVSALGMNFADLIRDRQDELALTQPGLKASGFITQWIADHIKWVLFLAVPFQALAARYFLFRKSGFNLVEHMVPLFYVSGHLFWLTMITFVLMDLMGNLYSVVVSILSLLYFGYVYADLMRYQSKVKAFAKGIGVYIGGQLIFVFVMIICVVLTVVVLGLVNPDALKALKDLKNG